MSSTADFLASLAAPTQQVVDIAIDDIAPDPNQPRTRFHSVDGQVDDQSRQRLEELADDIAEQGLLQPITVREKPEGGYQIVMGERRWRAVRLNRERGAAASDRTLRLPEVPAGRCRVDGPGEVR